MKFTNLGKVLVVVIFTFSVEAIAQFIPVIKTVHPNRIDGMLYGHAVVMDSGNAVVGAWFDSPVIMGVAQNLAGSAILFDTVNGTSRKLVASDASSNEGFGKSVDMDGNWLVVGAPIEDDTTPGGGISNINEGAAYLFFNDPVFGWVEKQKLIASDRGISSFANFGSDVGISGNFLVVGAPNNDNNPAGLTDAGAAYIFSLDPITGAWVETDRLLASDLGAADRFGSSVDIDGSIVAVGAVAEDEDRLGMNTLTNPGSAYVFELIGNGWTETAKLVARDRASEDAFGIAIEVHNGLVIVGSISDTGLNPADPVLNASGAAYTYKKNGAGNWRGKQKVVAPNRDFDEFFSFAISAHDDFVVFGAHFENRGLPGMVPLVDAGAAYVFRRSPSDRLRVSQMLVAPDRDVDDTFGYAVGTDGLCIVVGAREEDHDRTGANPLVNDGAAYFFCQETEGE